MLYDRWQAVAREHAGEMALVECATGRRWTFAELARAAETFSIADESPVVAHSQTAGFISTVLAAWRERRPLFPAERPVAGANFAGPIPSGIAHVKATSGTTGASQLIAFSAEQLAADAANIVASMGLNPAWPNLGVVSLAHSYGFSNLVTPLLLHGIPLVLCSSPMPEVVKSAAAGFRSLTLPAVPAMWRAWHEAGAIPPNISIGISAGTPLPLELEAAVLNSRGLKLHNFYGSSECGGIAFDRSSLPRTDASMIGQPMDNVSLSIGDDGCLIVRGAAVGTGYFPDGDARLGNGAFHTRDLAELREGQVLLRGRSSDVINIAGRKLSPESVEAVIRKQAGVRECLVVGVPARDRTRGEEGLAIVALAENAQLEAVRRATGSALPAWQRPRHWWSVPEIPTNARGKISRREWRKRFFERGSKPE